MRRRLVRLVAQSPLSLGLAACAGALPAEDVAAQAEKALEEQVARRSPAPRTSP